MWCEWDSRKQIYYSQLGPLMRLKLHGYLRLYNVLHSVPLRNQTSRRKITDNITRENTWISLSLKMIYYIKFTQSLFLYSFTANSEEIFLYLPLNILRASLLNFHKKEFIKLIVILNLVISRFVWYIYIYTHQ